VILNFQKLNFLFYRSSSGDLQEILVLSTTRSTERRLCCTSQGIN